MKKAIVIHEIYEDEQAQVGVYEYDTLPDNVRKKVDIARSYDGSVVLDPYENGLQFLATTGVSEVIGPVHLLGIVTFYDEE